jgi:hypothetical protein
VRHAAAIVCIEARVRRKQALDAVAAEIEGDLVAAANNACRELVCVGCEALVVGGARTCSKPGRFVHAGRHLCKIHFDKANGAAAQEGKRRSGNGRQRQGRAAQGAERRRPAACKQKAAAGAAILAEARATAWRAVVACNTPPAEAGPGAGRTAGGGKHRRPLAGRRQVLGDALK